MKGEKKVAEIQQGLQRTLSRANLEGGKKYEVKYEPLTQYFHSTIGATVNVSDRDSPAYNIFLVDKSNPSATYPIWQLFARDLREPLTPSMKEILYGSRAIPKLQKGIYDLENLQNREKSRNNTKHKGLETFSIVSIVGGAFFLSSSVTGNVIGLSNTTSSWIGRILILIGLIALGFWIKNRKDSHKGKMVVKSPRESHPGIMSADKMRMRRKKK